MFEAATTVGSGSQWQDGARSDVVLTKDRAFVRKLETTEAIQAEMMRLVDEHGRYGAVFLRDILCGASFAEYAARTKGQSRADIAAVAERFRSMLEEIAAGRGATGKATRRPVDKHDRAAEKVRAAYLTAAVK